MTVSDHVVQKPLELVCGRSLERFREPDHRKLECCEHMLMTNSGEAQKTRLLIEMCRLKAALMRFQLGMRTLLEIGFKAICVISFDKFLPAFCPCFKILFEAKFKS